MTNVTSSDQAQYAAYVSSASASINRHPWISIASELSGLSELSGEHDIRDNYGRGGIVSDFEGELCDVFNTPQCLFLPTGTLAQCTAAKCYSESSGKHSVGLHPSSHLLLHEHMAIETLWGLDTIEVGEYTKPFAVNDLRPLNGDKISTLIIELPMREIGGALPTWEQLQEIRGWCDTHQVKMHLDGARVWQTTHYYKKSLAEIAALFDSLYVSFYKDLGGISGAALLSNKTLIDEARIWARRAGGNPITQYPQVISARRGLRAYLDRMPQFVQYAAELAQVLGNIGGLSIHPKRPQTSMFHVEMPLSASEATQKILRYAQSTNIIVLPLPRSGNDNSCIFEITVGESTLAHSPEFWCSHLNACLDKEKQRHVK